MGDLSPPLILMQVSSLKEGQIWDLYKRWNQGNMEGPGQCLWWHWAIQEGTKVWRGRYEGLNLSRFVHSALDTVPSSEDQLSKYWPSEQMQDKGVRNRSPQGERGAIMTSFGEQPWMTISSPPFLLFLFGCTRT